MTGLSLGNPLLLAATAVLAVVVLVRVRGSISIIPTLETFRPFTSVLVAAALACMYLLIAAQFPAGVALGYLVIGVVVAVTGWGAAAVALRTRRAPSHGDTDGAAQLSAARDVERRVPVASSLDRDETLIMAGERQVEAQRAILASAHDDLRRLRQEARDEGIPPPPELGHP